MEVRGDGLVGGQTEVRAGRGLFGIGIGRGGGGGGERWEGFSSWFEEVDDGTPSHLDEVEDEEGYSSASVIILEMYILSELMPESPSSEDDGTGYDELDEPVSREPLVFEERDRSGEPGNENP